LSQPLVGVDDNKIEDFEALLRWHHPERGLVSPTEFISLAEETGLIIPLGEWELRTACAEAANWSDNIAVAVNIPALQVTNKNLINVIVGAIATAGFSANRLILEITESAFMHNTFANLVTLRSLHGLGVRFAMDDFGTGYSSLGYLMSFPFNKIKIDRSFVRDLPDKDESRAIVRVIGDMARNLNMQLVAEGVETMEQRAQLGVFGCTELQGFLISPPRSATEIRQLLPPLAQGAESAVSTVA
jgi:EAL domain-containing protein (putative c-di-GMP-specific phosphodiesterase class I)